MARTGSAAESRHESKTKLLDAALKVIRAKGYTATRVEDICEAAGLTKGSFFHHFKSKEDLAIAAAQHWSAVTGGLFVTATYHDHADPVDRLLGYLDLRKALLRGALAEFTCLAGTMVQELYATHPAIRDSCGASIAGHAATLVPDIDAARRQYGVAGDWSAESLALYTQAVLQGAFILAKAKQDPNVAADCIDHLGRYLEFLFRQPRAKEERS
jgi:TetR/AcrR family transcriptional regulator, transcriptional repressor for nem operon